MGGHEGLETEHENALDLSFFAACDDFMSPCGAGR